MPRNADIPKVVDTNSRQGCIIRGEAIPGSHRREFEAMAARRFQDPTPERSGGWWYIRVRQDVVEGSILTRKLKRIKVAPAKTPIRQVKRLVAEILRPMNQGLLTAGSAITFSKYVDTTYIPDTMRLLRKPTRDRYSGVIDGWLVPAFGAMPLSAMTFSALQGFCTNLDEKLCYESRDKIRDVLASVLHSAIKRGFLVQDPTVGLQLVPDKKARKKLTITPEEFDQLVNAIPEPYSTMLYVAGWTGLRVSELLGLKWNCIHADSICVSERYCRGDWDVPKTKSSAATIAVAPEVIDRINRLKCLSVTTRAGGQGATRTYKVVKASGPDDLIFQGLRSGAAMSDQNVLRRIIKPAAQRLGIKAVNWQILRRSHCTWLVQSGADPKSVQAQMRHSKISTTMYIYAQIVPQQQRIAVGKLTDFVQESVTESVTLLSQKNDQTNAEYSPQTTTIQ